MVGVDNIRNHFLLTGRIHPHDVGEAHRRGDDNAALSAGMVIGRENATTSPHVANCVNFPHISVSLARRPAHNISIHSSGNMPSSLHAVVPLCQPDCVKTLTLLSQKGGSGKTTLSLNLAIAAAHAKLAVVVIDLDPQQSASRWARLRKTDSPVIVSGHAPNLASLINQARDAGADLAIIDTAPKSESAALIAAKAADLVLIPCQPSSLDLDAVADSVNIARLAGRPAAFVLNGCKAGSSLTEMAAEALGDYGLPIAPVRVGSRVAFIKSLAEGKGVVEFEPSGRSAQEIRQLFTYARRHAGVKSCSRADTTARRGVGMKE